MDLTGQVHLLLGAPGQPAPTFPASPWRLWLLTEQGPVDPAAAAHRARLSPVAQRAEKALVAAVATDDVDALGRLAAQPGPAHDAARVLHAGRVVGLDPTLATEVLIAALSAPTDPSTAKLLQRHWPGLHVAVGLAPGVPALVPMSRTALGLLLAEVGRAQDRPADAVAVLRQLPPQPAVVLALAATLLAMGEHAQVLELTTPTANGDDISALALVARSVAARAAGDGPTAFDAASAALAVPTRSRAVLAAALEERAQVYALSGEEPAARADLEALAGLAAGAEPVIPEPTPVVARGPRPGAEEPGLDRARDRMRRRIMGVGAPGTFGGRHHSTYRDEIAEMFALGRIDAAEGLLIGLLDAVEDEVADRGGELDPTFFLTLADLYQDSGRTEDLHALQERFAAARARAIHPPADDAAPAGEERPVPAPFDAPAPTDPDDVSIDGHRVDVDAAVEHLLVSVGVAPAGEEAPVALTVPAPGTPPVMPSNATPAPEPEPEGEDEAGTAGPEDEAVGPEDETIGAEHSTPGDEVAPGDDAARPLTPVERAVRGPRVRSL